MGLAGVATEQRLVGSWCVFAGPPARLFLSAVLIVLAVFYSNIHAQNQLEDRPISDVIVTFEGVDKSISANETFRRIAREALGTTYSTVRVREAIEKLYATKQIAAVSVEASDGAAGATVRFVVRRKTQAQRVSIKLPEDDESKLTEQELLFRLNLLDAGTAITDQTLQNNANEILEYLRERGYFKAEVTFTQRPLDSETEVGVTFR